MGKKANMKTRRINIFDDTPRTIKCIEKTFDYMGSKDKEIVICEY